MSFDEEDFDEDLGEPEEKTPGEGIESKTPTGGG